MGRVRLLKGSEEFEMFQDFRKLLQDHWEVEKTDEYWQKVIAESDSFYRKYQTEFSKDLVLAFVNELERKMKHVTEM